MSFTRRAQGMRANRSHSYKSLERVARDARRRVCPELHDEEPLPLGASGIFERLDSVCVGDPKNPTMLTFAVNDLSPGIEGESRFDPDTNTVTVTLATATYTAVELCEPRGLFSVCHETVHVFEHFPILRQLSVLPHHEIALLRQEAYPIYFDTEWQADAAASAMIMPAKGLERLRLEGRLTKREVMTRFGASSQAASVRLTLFNEHRQKMLA